MIYLAELVFHNYDTIQTCATQAWAQAQVVFGELAETLKALEQQAR